MTASTNGMGLAAQLESIEARALEGACRRLRAMLGAPGLARADAREHATTLPYGRRHELTVDGVVVWWGEWRTVGAEVVWSEQWIVDPERLAPSSGAPS